MSFSITFSAPGSLMIMGEHAVLYGKPSLVMAHQHRIFVTITQRHDEKTMITSDLLGSLTLNELKTTTDEPWQFVKACFDVYECQGFKGFNINIQGFSSHIGFGSSAAVVVALSGALYCLKSQKIHHKDSFLNPQITRTITFSQCVLYKIFDLSKKIIKNVQGQGSGADVAASIFGGVVNYSLKKKKFTFYQHKLPLTAIYCGYKTPTKEVISYIKARKNKHPKIFKRLFDASESCVKEASYLLKKPFLDESHIERLGDLFSLHQGIMTAYGVSTKEIDDILNLLKTFPSIKGSKISGAGLGDCVIALGEVSMDVIEKINHSNLQFSTYPIMISSQGLTIHYNEIQ